jgi:hypothetical protein
MKKWKSFEDAKKFAHSLKLKNTGEWFVYWKSHKRPEDIPAGPFQVYKTQWIGWADFLGTGNLTPTQKHEKFHSYDNAKKYVQKLGIKTSTEFQKWIHSKERPDFIPTHPVNTYKEEWIDWFDFLGLQKKCSYGDAKKFAHSLNVQSRTDWFDFHKKGKIPKNIPKYADESYINDGWVSWGDFLGTGNLSGSQLHTKFRSFEDAREFVKSLKIKTEPEWQKWCKNHERPKDVPFSPEKTYKKQWTTMGDWFGTGIISSSILSKNYLPLVEARKKSRELAKKYNLKTFEDWKKAKKEGKIPDNIPMYPDRIYSKKRKK